MLPPMPLVNAQVTGVFELKVALPPGNRSALAGVIVTTIGATTVIVAVALAVGLD